MMLKTLRALITLTLMLALRMARTEKSSPVDLRAIHRPNETVNLVQLPTFNAEPSIIDKIDFYSGFSLALIFVLATLTGSVGMGSASLTIGMVLFGLQVHTEEATRLINIATVCAAIVNCLFVASLRRQENPDELYLDWGLAAYCLPQVLAGSMIGLVLKRVIPEGYGYVATGLLILVLSYAANREAKRIEMHEESGFQTNLSDRTWIRMTDSSAHFFKNLTSVARSSLLEIVSQNLLQILIIKSSVVLMIVGNLIRTWSAAQSAIGLGACSILTFVMFVACAGTVSYLSYFAKQRVQTNYNPQRQLTLISASFCAGVFFWLNPMGSVVFWLFLFILGVEPMAVWAVSSSQLFYTSCGALIQDMLINPPSDFVGIGIFAGIGTIGALMGNFFVQWSFKKQFGAQSFIAKIGCLIGLLSLTMMLFNADQGRAYNSDFWKFGSLC